VGRSTKEIWGVPLVASFHTLGKVKNYSLALGERPEPRARVSGEERVTAEADRLVAATPAEAAQLVGLYRADAERIRVVPPGVDHAVFFPRPPDEAAARLHLSGARLLLFVGRLQMHKGPDVAVRTLAEVIAQDPDGTEDVLLAESFGLVALEAQACGTPVVASAVGGLRYVVVDGVTGRLVEGHDPGDHAARVLELLRDRAGARAMGRAGLAHSARFSWDSTAEEMVTVYRELLDGARAS
jgi:D-inositol-3-phosphate glycosyltransferase